MDDSDPGPVVVDEIRLRAILKKLIDDELKPTFLKMLEKSESRIDRTNRMVNKLANAMQWRMPIHHTSARSSARATSSRKKMLS